MARKCPVQPRGELGWGCPAKRAAEKCLRIRRKGTGRAPPVCRTEDVSSTLARLLGKQWSHKISSPKPFKPSLSMKFDFPSQVRFPNKTATERKEQGLRLGGEHRRLRSPLGTGPGLELRQVVTVLI